MQQTITIERRGLSKSQPVLRDQIDADVEGAFGIHETVPVELGGYTVTHIPTGWACVMTAHEIAAKAARAELLASGLDWSFTNPRKLTAEHKRVGKAIKQKYEGR